MESSTRNDEIEEVRRSYRDILSVEERKSELKQRMEYLENSKKQLQQEFSSQDSTSRKAILRYSRCWGQNFGTRLRTTLPRELRDMIYDHLVVLPPAWLISRLGSRNEYFWIRRRPYIYGTDSELKDIERLLRRVLKPHFLEEDIRCELTARFFSKNLFHGELTTIPRLNDIQATFHTRQSPAELIRRALFRFDTSDFTANAAERWNWESFVENLPSTNHFTEAVPISCTKANLETRLGWIKNKQGFEVHIVFYGEEGFLWHSMLVNLGSMVYRLKDEGFCVRVLVVREDDDAPGTMDSRTALDAPGIIELRTASTYPGEKLYSFPGEDWTHIFHSSKAEFQKRAQDKTILPEY